MNATILLIPIKYVSTPVALKFIFFLRKKKSMLILKSSPFKASIREMANNRVKLKGKQTSYKKCGLM